MDAERYKAMLKAWEAEGNSLDHLNEPDHELFKQCVKHLGRAVITKNVPSDEHPRAAATLMLTSPRNYVQAKVIRWLCTSKTARQYINPHGIVLQNAIILGEWNKEGKVILRGLDLAHVDVSFPIEFRNCYIPGGIRLTSAKTRTIILRQCDVGPLLAAGLHLDGSLLLDRGERERNDPEDNKEPPPVTRVFGGMTLYGATITRDLSCQGAIIYSRATGLQSPANATPPTFGREDLETFDSPSLQPWMAINADDLSVGNVYFRFGFEAHGSVRLKTARIRSDLHCENGLFTNPTGWSLNARGSTVGGDVRLCCRAAFVGGIDLSVADIHGNLHIGDVALCYSYARDLAISPEARPEQCALFADGLRVQGNVDFRRAPSFVAVFGNQIGTRPKVPLAAEALMNQLDRRARWQLKSNIHRLLPQRCRSEAMELLAREPSARVVGTISLIGAHIRGTLDCLGLWVRPAYARGFSLRLSRAVINGVLFLNSRFDDSETVAPFAAVGIVELTFCRAKILFDCPISWPRKSALFLEGFRYDEIAEDSIHKSPRGAERPGEIVSRLEWLLRQPLPRSQTHDPQPYEQAARVLRKSGHELAWRELAAHSRKLEMEDRSRELWRHVWRGQTPLHKPGPLLDRVGAAVKLVLLHVSRPVLWLAGYGFNASRASVVWIAMVILGTIVFGAWNPIEEHTFVPAQSVMYATRVTEEKEWKHDYPAFNSFLYALDSALPVINLHQEAFWVPSPHGSKREIKILGMTVSWGEVCECYLALHIMCGWLLFTITLITLTRSLWKEAEELEE